MREEITGIKNAVLDETLVTPYKQANPLGFPAQAFFI